MRRTEDLRVSESRSESERSCYNLWISHLHFIQKKKMSDALLNFLVEIASHIITLIILAYIPLVTFIIFRAVRLRGLNEENMADRLMDLCFDTLRGFLFFILFYWLYTDFILLLFRIVQLDLLVATIGSQPLDFGFLSLFDSGADSLPTLESESSSASLSTYRNVIAAESESDIYNRIRHLERGLC